MSPDKRINFPRGVLVITALLTFAVVLQGMLRLYRTDEVLVSRRWAALIILVTLSFLAELALLSASWTRARDSELRFLDSLLYRLRRLRWGNTVLLIALLLLFCYLTLGPLSRYFGGLYMRLLLYWLLILAGSVLLAAAGLKRSWFELSAAVMVSAALVYRLALYLPELGTHPFSLGWSEASRFYYASLYFSRQIYNIQIPPTVLHPSRYIMQAVPFLIPNSPIWLHRLWQVLLWAGVTALSAWLLARRLAIGDRFHRRLFIAWVILFLLIGPVYYHLQVAVIIVLATFNRRRFWLSALGVVLASAWAGISRINWFPVPGMLAISLFLLEETMDGKRLWRYLLKPAMWAVLGIVAAFASQSLYALASGNPVEQFATSFTSDLLWYRLLPNPTYPIGVLPAVLLVSAPFWLVILSRLHGRWSAYHPFRLIGLTAMLFVLLLGGLVVSTKIGGGSNLHNIDAYLTLLLVISAYFFFNKAVSDQRSAEALRVRPVHWSVILYALALPALLTVTSGSPYPPPDRERVDRALLAIELAAKNAREDTKKDVLFLSERQLLTFHNLTDIPLVGDYEKVFLMEMAMAENPGYLGKFHADLKNQRFSLIVSEPLNTKLKGRAKSFGEENDAWVKNVSEPILCYYEPFRTFRELRLQLLKPRSQPGTCPNP
jgi:hypothetical protein